MPGLLVAVEGPSGTGKTTVAREAARRFGWLPLSEAYDRLSPRPSLEYRTVEELADLELRLLREDAARYREARRATSGGATVLADTGFLGPLTYAWALVRLGDAPGSLLAPLITEASTLAARGEWGLPDLVVWLRTTEPTRLSRSRSDPSGHPVRLDARHAAVAREEHRFYRAFVADRFPGLVRTISGAGTPSAVVGRVEREVVRVRPLPPSPGRLASLLVALGTPDSVP